MKKNFIRCGATLVATTVLFGSFPYSAMAWEDDTMKKLAEVSLMTGQKTEDVEQNAPLTRAEFMALVNRMLGFTEESDDVKKYTDIAADAWYYHDVAKAIEAKYICGTDQNKMSPLDQITNQEMYAILTRIATKEEGKMDLKDVPDQTDIANWAKQGIEQAILNGYVLANDDFKLNPTKQTTKADAMKLLENLKNEDKVFYYPGTYNISAARNVKILANDVSIKDAVIKGDLTLGDKVKTVDLGNVQVTGTIVKENKAVEIVGNLVWNDGIFIGVAEGKNGPIKINVEIVDGKIKNISILEHKEKPESLEKIQKLLKKVVEAGTFEGIEIGDDKTINSEGFLNAVKDAIAQSTKVTAKPGESKAAQKYKNLKDGTYEGISNGYGGKLRVKIEIKDGKLVDLKVVEHSETSSYFDAVQRVIKQIIEKGGVDGVDTVSGATLSSKAIINAVKDAMSQAVGITEEAGKTEAATEVVESSRKGKKPTQPQGNNYSDGSLANGTYHGKAVGYGGALKVTVTVSNGKIANVVVDSHKETPSYYEKAKVILDQIVEKNSTAIDTISGATSTSKALLSAVENALGQKKEPLEYADGTWYGQGHGHYNSNQHITEAAVTIEGGKITKVELIHHGDDEPYRRPNRDKPFQDYIVKHNGTDGLNEILANKERGNPVYDTVSGATNSARGYLHAIDDALTRAAKYKKDKVEQTIRSVSFIEDSLKGKHYYYGKEIDLSDIILQVKFRDGNVENVRMDELQKYGLKSSCEVKFYPEPNTPQDYSDKRIYQLQITDPVSTSTTSTEIYVVREVEFKYAKRIEITTSTESISVDLKPDEFRVAKNIETLGDIQEIKLYDTEGNLMPLKKTPYTLKTDYGIILEIHPEPMVVDKSDIIGHQNRYPNYVINFTINKKLEADKINSIKVMRLPKTEYDVNQTLDLNGLELQVMDTNHAKATVRANELGKFGLTASPANNEKLTKENTKVTISHTNGTKCEIPLIINDMQDMATKPVVEEKQKAVQAEAATTTPVPKSNAGSAGAEVVTPAPKVEDTNKGTTDGEVTEQETPAPDVVDTSQAVVPDTTTPEVEAKPEAAPEATPNTDTAESEPQSEATAPESDGQALEEK